RHRALPSFPTRRSSDLSSVTSARSRRAMRRSVRRQEPADKSACAEKALTRSSQRERRAEWPSVSFFRVLRVREFGLHYNPPGPRTGDRTVKLLVVSFVLVLSSSAFAQSPSGSTVFTDHCATCHAGNDQRIPTVAALRQRTPEAIVDALTTGAMRQQGAELTDAERRAVAEFLGGRSAGTVAS